MTGLVEVRPAGPAYAGLLAALAAETLAIDDVGRSHARFFMLSDKAGQAVAFAGLEGEGADLLLCSVVVDPGRRASGTGREVVAAVEAAARISGARTLWLLTTDAAPFFDRLGYRPADRATTPATIAATAQFRGLCPASAALLRKPLDGASA